MFLFLREKRKRKVGLANRSILGIMRLNLSKRIAGTIALCACFGLWNALRCAFKAEDRRVRNQIRARTNSVPSKNASSQRAQLPNPASRVFRRRANCLVRVRDCSLEGDSDWDLDKEFRRYCDMGCLVQSAEMCVPARQAYNLDTRGVCSTSLLPAVFDLRPCCAFVSQQKCQQHTFCVFVDWGVH